MENQSHWPANPYYVLTLVWCQRMHYWWHQLKSLCRVSSPWVKSLESAVESLSGAVESLGWVTLPYDFNVALWKAVKSLACWTLYQFTINFDSLLISEEKTSWKDAEMTVFWRRSVAVLSGVLHHATFVETSQKKSKKIVSFWVAGKERSGLDLWPSLRL